MITVRLNEEESIRFDALAEHYGLSISSLVRMLLKRDADILGFETEHSDNE